MIRLTLNLRCSKEMRQTWHTVTIEENKEGVSQITFKCQTCKNPFVREDVIVEDMTSVKKDIMGAYNNG